MTELQTPLISAGSTVTQGVMPLTRYAHERPHLARRASVPAGPMLVVDRLDGRGAPFLTWDRRGF